MKTIHLIFGTHNSQPAGNFDYVIEKVYHRAYKPFISIINTFQDFPVTLHYSGVLYEWLEEKHPEFLMVLGEMVNRKQVELLGGGYYEPVLSLIPNSDKLGQIESLTTYIRSHFGQRPRGSWVTERVWEPNYASILQHSGIEYIFLDDIHFKFAGVDDELYYPYLTEDQGKTITVFPLSKPLRYLIPYRNPEEVVDYIMSLATEEGDRVITIIDNGEKFGEWEGSFRLCYEEKWLSRFIELIRLNNECIKPVHPLKYIKTYQCKEKIYFPSMLYDEMMEWIYGNSHSRPQNEGKWKTTIRTGGNGFFPGGLFRKFLCKYPESNLMYSKMMYVNILVNQIRGDKYKKKAAKQELWKGQSNHAYWHGKFGGIYFNHLRKEVYRSLLEAEFLTRAGGGFLPSLIKSDFDMDGREEILFSGTRLNAYIHTKGGMLFELDYLPVRWNYLDTLSRYAEYYHSYMEKENGYDWYLRKAFIDHFCETNTDIFSFSKMNYIERGDFINSYYSIENIDKDNFELTLKRNGNVRIWDTPYPVQIVKKFRLKKGRITVHYTITNCSEIQLVLFFGVEINLALSSNKESDSRVKVIQGKTTIPLKESFLEVNNVSSFHTEDLLNKVLIKTNFENPCSLWVLPVETISQSIEKLDRIYQSTCFMPFWNFTLPVGESWSTSVVLELDNLLS
ncbi:MAG: DUF1926 domain-containing protein [Spirochaetales bacterium]|nr:DUF1926 domain-containing protein [Spirochaetales bacterium]